MFDQQEEHRKDYDPEVEEEEEAEEVDDPIETQSSGKAPSMSRAQKNCQDEYIALCHASMNVPLDALVGTDQPKDKFWGRIEEYYSAYVEVASNYTQGSLGHHLGTIQDQATDGPIVLVRSTMCQQVGCKCRAMDLSS